MVVKRKAFSSSYSQRCLKRSFDLCTQGENATSPSVIYRISIPHSDALQCYFSLMSTSYYNIMFFGTEPWIIQWYNCTIYTPYTSWCEVVIVIINNTEIFEMKEFNFCPRSGAKPFQSSGLSVSVFSLFSRLCGSPGMD